MVMFCGRDQVVIGEHKTHAGSKTPVTRLVAKADLLRQRAKEGYEAYTPFQNKKLGLAFMAEIIAPKAQLAVQRACEQHGIALFHRSGAAIRLAVPPGHGIMKFS